MHHPSFRSSVHLRGISAQDYLHSLYPISHEASSVVETDLSYVYYLYSAIQIIDCHYTRGATPSGAQVLAYLFYGMKLLILYGLTAGLEPASFTMSHQYGCKHIVPVINRRSCHVVVAFQLRLHCYRYYTAACCAVHVILNKNPLHAGCITLPRFSHTGRLTYLALVSSRSYVSACSLPLSGTYYLT